MASDTGDQDPPTDSPPDDAVTRILRRAPLNTGSQPVPSTDEPATSIIRRHPTGEFPVAAESDTEPPTGLISRAQPVAIGPPRAPHVPARSAIATAVVSILSGWATAVIATNLISGWSATDPLFCVAIGFLAAISAAATIGGLIALLLRRRMGRLLVIVGAAIALLIFAGLFVAGAALPALVYAMPVLPVASIVLALLPETARWGRS
ncbi:hypothetical protein FK535_14195 [Mycolicibacterium sp. 018/SC-01/001]|uniref:hypothetical protein n=1 Tax=Mycolicibacterium sp. 018/SC-01/001 TaxID=2592069 RepID=UPI00117DA6B3|nr:hypothetical protein [Mycolicibacterium sp. 018/SC-01/001]TRW82034.1 hypothetical protein FK535_14195 [Mycolicibacterium sp. 018/SC-01/001]